MVKGSSLKYFSRRRFIKYGSMATGTCLLAVFGDKNIATATEIHQFDADTIKVGIMYSTTGNAAVVEKSLQEATFLAIEQINSGTGPWAENGVGIFGRKIEPVVVNPSSDWDMYNQASKNLINKGNIAWVLGENILSKQEIRTAMSSLYKGSGSSGFFVSSDFVYARAATATAKAELEKLGGNVVGDEYTALDESKFSHIIETIKAAQPDFIVSGLVGDDDLAFQRQLLDVKMLDICASIGGYPTVYSPVSSRFTEQFQSRFGTDRIVTPRIETAYTDTIEMAVTMKSILASGGKLSRV